jgi:hypothetical protein
MAGCGGTEQNGVVLKTYINPIYPGSNTVRINPVKCAPACIYVWGSGGEAALAGGH